MLPGLAAATEVELDFVVTSFLHLTLTQCDLVVLVYVTQRNGLLIIQGVRSCPSQFHDCVNEQ